MPRITEITGAQTPIAALLKDGLTSLSGDQHVTFNLYRKFTSPLDGLVYWLRVKEGEQTATVRMTGGLRSKTGESKTSVQAVEGNIGALDILGGWLTNPKSAVDQGQDTKAFVLRVSVTGPASQKPDAWTSEILPGDTFEIPPAPSQGVWVQSDARKHKFTVQLKRSIEPLSGQPVTIEQSGSLHYASETEQDEDTVSDTNTVMFTSKAEIRPFNLIGPEELYIGERDDIRFSFSSRGNYYESADLWHYLGTAIQSYMEPLIVEDPEGWYPDLFVTNSLPIWLSFVGYVPPYPGFVCPFPIFPSYLIPDNAKLPYAAIHVDETQALQAVPSRGPRMEHDQLASDRVKVTLYGASARRAADFFDFALQFMRDAGKLGLMQTPPVMRDEHMKQPEYRILAQKKVIEFEVSYSQMVARDLARQRFDKDRVKVQLSPAPIKTTPSPLLEPIVKGADIDIDCPREENGSDAAGDREAVPRCDDANHDASHEAAAAPAEDRASSSRRARDAARERTAAGKRAAARRERTAAGRSRRGATAESLAPEPAQ